ncbi:MAG: carboxylating nicotinate-nucleotide diphosphorylase [Candidatus Micrarchaeota archaeon]|nr:carboxylating nicotinate-nucleotide diphosphorylase [Candidatus Micrarchaeota archaeon]
MKKPIWAFQKKPDDSLAAKNALLCLRQDAEEDITSRCLPKSLECSGKIVAKSSFVLCGVLEADAAFRKMKVNVRWNFSEGQKVRRGEAVCRVWGNARAVLAAERTALNYLSLLSGTATQSAKAAEKYGRGKIAATRKTLPLLAHSQKRAVAIGGCLTHRISLASGYLVKDNHISAIAKSRKASRAEAIRIALSRLPEGKLVQVEVSSESEAEAAALHGAKAILADNVRPSELARIAKTARRIFPGMIVEASGGISLQSAGKYLKAGADFVSTSQLTAKPKPADLSLEIEG